MLPIIEKLKTPIAKVFESTSDESVSSFFDFIKKEWGEVDYVVHSIAFSKKEHLRGKFIDIDRKGFLVAQEVSVFSFVDVLKRAEPLLSSNASCLTLSFLGAEKVFPNYNTMGVAKAALESAVRYAAYDFGGKNVRVNAISSGPIPTSAASAIKGFDDLYFDYIRKSPLNRATSKEEVANTALFLLSNLSSGITGEVIHVDCGYHILGI
jgi:enoyl-[acyl-carrier protein] reductase I